MTGDVQLDGALADIAAALASPDGSIRIVQTFSHGRAVQVYRKTRKVGPLVIPNDGETVGDVVRTLVDMEVPR